MTMLLCKNFLSLVQSIAFIFTVAVIAHVPGGTNGSLFGDDWSEDVGAAFVKARKDNLDVLMVFVGTDWDLPSQKFEKNILSDADFQTEIKRRFAVVKLDFLRNSPQEPSIVEQNKNWAATFGVNAYPTIFMLDQHGKPYAIAGYEDWNVADYLGLLEENRQLRIRRDDKLAEAAGKDGLERAKALDDAIGQMRMDLAELYYREIIDEIIALDKDDDAGLRTKWNATEEAEIRKAILTDVMTIARLEKPLTAIQFIDDVLAEFAFPINQKMEILNVKLNLIRQTGDQQRVDELMDQMIGLDEVTVETKARLMAKKVYLMAGSNRLDPAWRELERSLTALPNNPYLLKAKGELYDAAGQHAEAIEVYNAALKVGGSAPDLLIEIVAAKADSQMDLNQEVEALATLDQFIDNAGNPADLRAQALLHKSVIMRERNRIRQARLAENRAIEIIQSSQQRREIQKLVESLRAKYGD
jgi:tetratricopeptide (TPR) repeat protein